MTAYYNEIDPNAAQWLRNLISAGHIAPGVVDDRSIEDVTPNDLRGFTQCHFFAGIGIWSHALRLSDWSDDRPTWTASCPCQPFSEAGKGKGSADERHLWPAFYHLVEQCRPRVVFGEQVEAAIKHSWLDLVQSDMERSDYAFAAFGLPAAGFGAPHIRSRLYFVAYANSNRFNQGRTPPEIPRYRSPSESGGGIIDMADSDNTRLEGRQRMFECSDQCFAGPDSMASRMANTDMLNAITAQPGSDPEAQRVETELGEGVSISGKPSGTSLDVCSRPRLPTDGFWRDVDWIGGRDSKWRPVEPGTSPLVDGDTARVVKLRAYGNAIVPQVAQEMISAFMEMGNG